MSLVVSDTTPLNYLILIGHVEVLPRLFGTLLVPPAVIQEMHHPKTPPEVAAWARHLPSWLEVTTALLRASVERRIQGVAPSTQRDIIAEALSAWLKKNGYSI